MTKAPTKKKIVTRKVGNIAANLSAFDPILQRIFAARGITSNDELDRSLAKLPSPWLLSGMEVMVSHLITAIKNTQKIVIVADFDADGATSCAVAIRGLSLLGAKKLAFVVPNRFEYGYGLTPEIVALVKQQNPDVEVIVTVDNGISSIAGVKAAKDLGIKVLVTDHHLPAAELPAADAIVNPNLVDDKFPSRNIAGVGVIFYVLMALRARLRELDYFHDFPEPNLGQLLDFVALGTVADVVRLDTVNRIFVYQGLLRMRSGRAHAGINALMQIAKRNPATLTPSDLGFALAPRLNAAGRMDDMSIGIQGFLSDDSAFSYNVAQQLDDFNQKRKEVEGEMKQQATLLLEELHPSDEHHTLSGVCLFDKDWHQGVIGILAARIKERLHRPVIAFAPADDGEIKGSARSIEGVHIRDVLADIAAAHPHLLEKFGGHAMAAGLSLHMRDYPAFALAFDEVVEKHLHGVDLQQKIDSDGELSAEYLNLEFAEHLQNAATWGQGFPEPIFHGVFDVIQCRIVGGHHLKLVLRQPFADLFIDGIAFFVDYPENWLGIRQINAAYKLDINEYRGERSLQLQVQYLEKIQ
ncbi:MAG: single-stranded-DNA-specific exonuclease RecJ [Methylococcaceae bacterium]|nr:single-stranded-DNA-specific exonuclease RecJ [Methylococcaceae bacterium]